MTISTALSLQEVERRLQRIVCPKMSLRDSWRWAFGRLHETRPFEGTRRHHKWRVRRLTHGRSFRSSVVIRIVETETGSDVRINVWPELKNLVGVTLAIAGVIVIAREGNGAPLIGALSLFLILLCGSYFADVAKIRATIRREL